MREQKSILILKRAGTAGCVDFERFACKPEGVVRKYKNIVDRWRTADFFWREYRTADSVELYATPPGGPETLYKSWTGPEFCKLIGLD